MYYKSNILPDIPWPVVPDEMSEEAFDLIDKLLQIDPSMRLGFKGKLFIIFSLLIYN